MKILMWSNLFLVINYVKTSELNHNQENTSRFFNDNVFLNSYYDYDSIFVGIDNAWNSLILHTFRKQTSNHENLSFSDMKEKHTLQNSSIETFQEHQNSKVNTIGTLSKNCGNDFLDRFDLIETPEIVEQLNNTELQVLDNKDLDEIFKNESFGQNQSNKSDNLIYKKCTDKIIGSINKKNKRFIERHDIIFEKYMLKIKYKIIRFIKRNFTVHYASFYIRRLEIIESAFNFIRQKSNKHYEYGQINLSNNHIIIGALNRLHDKFKKEKTFDQKTCNLFSEALNYELPSRIKTISRKELLLSLEDYDKLNFYFRLINLYKYIDEIPELLTLSGLYTERLPHDLPFMIHLINIFIEKIGNLQENRVFILYMIYNAFTFSYKKFLDFFKLEKFDLYCHKEHLNGFFFLWEIHRTKRKDMIKRLDRWKFLKCKNLDEAHFKTILFIYLYQHVDCLIFYEFSDSVVQNYSFFVKKVLNSNECFACHFDEFLKIAKEHLKSVK